MSIRIEFFSIEITDYDEAIRFYSDCLGFFLVEDEPMGETGRWITMRPSGHNTSDIAFTLVPNTKGKMIGALRTEDVWMEYHRMVELGVEFSGEPEVYPFGTGVILSDPFGNRFFLAEEPE